jgi:hypothetical protein
MTHDWNERRIKALTGAVERAIHMMIANANAAGWSADEAIAAIDRVVVTLKMSNACDPDPADDPVSDWENGTGTAGDHSAEDVSSRPEDPCDQSDEDKDIRLAEENADLPTQNPPCEDIPPQGERNSAAIMPQRLMQE